MVLADAHLGAGEAEEACGVTLEALKVGRETPFRERRELPARVQPAPLPVRRLRAQVTLARAGAGVPPMADRVAAVSVGKPVPPTRSRTQSGYGLLCLRRRAFVPPLAF